MGQVEGEGGKGKGKEAMGSELTDKTPKKEMGSQRQKKRKREGRKRGEADAGDTRARAHKYQDRPRKGGRGRIFKLLGIGVAMRYVDKRRARDQREIPDSGSLGYVWDGRGCPSTLALHNPTSLWSCVPMSCLPGRFVYPAAGEGRVSFGDFCQTAFLIIGEAQDESGPCVPETE